jgi:hypothetical protein
MLKYHFLYHDGSSVSFEAADCKHYIGHAALTNTTVVDRIDSYKGYVFGNIRFVTFSANSRGEKKPFRTKR